MDINNEIDAIIKSSGFKYVAELNLENIEYHSELRDMCKMDTCGRYAKTWNCPPVIGSLEELSEECKSFSNGFIFSFVSELKDSFDFEGMAEAGSELCRKLCDTKEKLEEAINDTSAKKIPITSYKLYGSGACFSCEKCSYPDAPCLHPEMCFIPIEACGIYVTKVAKEVGLNYNNGPDTVTFFGMLMYK